MAPRIASITDVAERHLCAGCGVCAYLQPESISMVDALAAGRRPLVILNQDGSAPDTTKALAGCPGNHLEHKEELPSGHATELGSAWGPVLEVWEGYAADDEIRFRGSSGGAATALALHSLGGGAMAGVLHTAPRADNPVANATVLSRSRADLLAATGSRYAPASPCDGLDLVRDASAPCLVIGKPCDIAGASHAAEMDSDLAAKIGATIAIFCAGTPTTEGTQEAIASLGISEEDVVDVRYRGHGWPGEFVARTSDGADHALSYEQSWGEILQRHRQWRCMICPDHTGEFADISVGDPWYRPIEPGEPGRSLVLARTERGRALVRDAIAAGHLVLEKVPPDLLVQSQPNLLLTRGAVWGRMSAMRAAGLPVPRYRRLPMFAVWLRRLTLRQKAQSLIGTAKRIHRRGLRRRKAVDPI